MTVDKKNKKKPVGIHKRIGLAMPIGRILAHMRRDSHRVSNASGVATGAFLERLGVLVMDASSKRCRATTHPNKQTGVHTITHHHVNSGIDQSALFRSLMRRTRLPTPVGQSGCLAVKPKKIKRAVVVA